MIPLVEQYTAIAKRLYELECERRACADNVAFLADDSPELDADLMIDLSKMDRRLTACRRYGTVPNDENRRLNSTIRACKRWMYSVRQFFPTK